MFVQTLWEPGHVLCSVFVIIHLQIPGEERKQRLSFRGSLLGLLFIPGVAVKQDLYLYKTAATLAGVGRTHQEFSDVSQISLQEHWRDGYDGYDGYDRDVMDMTFYLVGKPAASRAVLLLSCPNSASSHSSINYIQVKLSPWRLP